MTRALLDQRQAMGLPTFFNAHDVKPANYDTASPCLSFRCPESGDLRQAQSDFIAACDGSFSACRASLPTGACTTFEHRYPFAWLGVLANTKPLETLSYGMCSQRGFWLGSLRSPTVSRFYIQVPPEASLEQWSDAAFWRELQQRLPPALAAVVQPAPSLEKSIFPLRQIVAEPMRFGRMFLAGDAAHVFLPTCAKGLNMAVADVSLLSRALVDWYGGSTAGVNHYSQRCLQRVWRAQRLADWMTTLLHLPQNVDEFEGAVAARAARMKRAEFDRLCESEAAQQAFAEEYVGLPWSDCKKRADLFTQQRVPGSVLDTTNGTGPMPADYLHNQACLDEIKWLRANTSTAMQDTDLVEWVLQTAEKGNPQSILDVIDEHCSQQLGHWHWNLGPVKGLILDKELHCRRPLVTMEWGAYIGYSSIRMGALVRQWGGRVVSLEISPERCQLAARLAAHAGLANISFVSGPVQDSLRALREAGEKPVDLLVIDHEKNQYLSDLRVAESCGLIKPGTVLVADNVIFPGCPEYLKYVRDGRNGYTSKHVPAHLEYVDHIVDGIEISTKIVTVD